MPLEVERHTVSHMKPLISGELDYRGLMRGSLFTLCHPLLKVALLVHRMGLGRFVSLSTVLFTDLRPSNTMIFLCLNNQVSTDFRPVSKARISVYLNIQLIPDLLRIDQI